MGSVRQDGALSHGRNPEPVRSRGRTTRVPDRNLTLAALCGAALLLVAPLEAQQTAASWNDAQVLRLLDRATELRSSATVDPNFSSYSAEARGYVYFFVDRPDSATQFLVKADQVALDLYWRAPNQTLQRIVGQRDEKLLPTRIRYHIDHLTVVQDDFGDFIRMGDGDEVEQVIHPVSARGREVYDFQLSDSLTLSYAGGAEVIRVYEVRVRPRDFSRPGYVGTVFLDRDRAAIVRMNFSFTPASYVDPYIDYIRISMDHSLWMGAHWLPYRQEVEIRREIPVLDFMSGSIIRSRFDVRGYEFNVEIPDQLWAGPTVSTVPLSQRRAFAFERGIFDDLEETGGLRPSPSIDEVQTQVREVVEDEVMSGLDPLRLHLSRLSDFARYNRAEGIFGGAGMTVRATGDVVLRGTAGYSIGRRRGSGALTARSDRNGFSPSLEAYWDLMGDVGRHPGSTPLENTISSASGSKDYLDPYFRRGATLTLGARPAGAFTVSATLEEHVAARDVVSDGPDTEFRPVRSIDEGTMTSLTATTRFGLPGGGGTTLTATGGRLGGENFGALTMDASWSFADPGDHWNAETTLSGGITTGGAPAQSMFLIGGRHTLPGHAYRSFIGDRYWLLRTEGTVPVRPPWLGIRAFMAVGSTHISDDTQLPVDWLARDSRGLRGSVGLGLSIGWDAMRVDVGRAVWGSGWEVVFSTAPRFRDWL